MSKESKILILREFADLINSINGIDDYTIRKIGLSLSEIENPTKETNKKLRKYIANRNKENNFHI